MAMFLLCGGLQLLVNQHAVWCGLATVHRLFFS